MISQYLTQPELADYNGATYPEGDWHVDRCQILGLDSLKAILNRSGKAYFTVVSEALDTFAIREANPANGTRHHGMAYPEREEGARGPLARWTQIGEDFALRCFIVSHAALGEAATWQVWREGGATFAALVS